MNTEIIAAAIEFGAATLHEAQGRRGDLPAGIRALAPGMRLGGPAYTVRTRMGHNLLLHRAIAGAPSGSVLVAATGGPEGYEWGYWGDIMTTAAQARGIVGLIIDGCVRDRDAITNSGFPVFCRGTAIRGTEKSPDGALDAPVVLGNALVSPGDLVVADNDGVVVVCKGAIDSVLSAARAREEKETAVLAALRTGRTTLELFGWS